METKVKVYVAGKWSDRKQLQLVMNDLRDLGFDVISGWVEREDRAYTPEALGRCGKLDIDEVSECDVLLAVMNDPEYPYRGTYSEVGCALGLKKKVVVVCNGTSECKEDKYEFSHYCMRNVFYWHPSIVHVSTIDEAIAAMKL